MLKYLLLRYAYLFKVFKIDCGLNYKPKSQ